MDTTTSHTEDPTTDPAGTSRPDHNVWVGLSSDDPHAARAWLRALGFADGIVVEYPDGSVRHSEMLWPEGGRVMVSSRSREDGTFVSSAGAATLYVVTDDMDAVWERARNLGASVVRELADTDYGSRGFSLVDDEGNSWSFGTYAG